MDVVEATKFGDKQRSFIPGTPTRPKYMQVPGVPETITRDDYVAWIEALGFEAKNLKAMTLEHFGVTAVVYAVDEHGHKFTADGETAATHTITVRVVDDET